MPIRPLLKASLRFPWAKWEGVLDFPVSKAKWTGLSLGSYNFHHPQYICVTIKQIFKEFSNLPLIPHPPPQSFHHLQSISFFNFIFSQISFSAIFLRCFSHTTLKKLAQMERDEERENGGFKLNKRIYDMRKRERESLHMRSSIHR